MTEATIKHVPKLRFPGFSEGWIVRKLGEIAQVTSGGTPSRTNLRYWNGGIPWVTTSEIDFNIITTVRQSISELGLRNSAAKLLPAESILVALYGQGKTRGKVAVLGIDATTNQACAAIIPDGERLDRRFLFQNLASRYDELRELSNDGSQKNLSGQLIKSLQLTMPSVEEQEKIAGFLAVVDEQIGAIDKKAELLKQYKKGVMQKIFSQQLRFEDRSGKSYPAWQKKRLGDIAEVYQPVTISQSSLTPTGEFPVYGANGIIGYFNRYNHENAQVAVTCRGNTCGTVNLTKPKAWITGNAMVINVDNHNEADRKFIYYLLSNDNLDYLITGSGQPQITGEIKKHKIKLPSVEEQRKIAGFLTGLDDKIKIAKSKLEQATRFKKALLQQMFI